MLDANADMTDLEFSSFLVVCGLQDLHDNCDIVPLPETYYRGKRKIDFCLGTPGVANAVTCQHLGRSGICCMSYIDSICSCCNLECCHEFQ